MKKSLLLFISLFVTIAATAATSYKSVKINMRDGSNLLVTIEQGMTTQVIDGNLKMTCDKGDVILPFSEVANWTFSTDPGSSDRWSAIHNLDSDASDVRVKIDGSILSVAGLKANSRIQLISMSGRSVAIKRVMCGEIQFDISNLPRGIYILKFDNHSLKIAIGR